MCIRDRIRGQIEETKSEFDKEKLQERLAKLAGGVAVIRVGEMCIRDRSYRAFDKKYWS